jgi:hypothetical protein
MPAFFSVKVSFSSLRAVFTTTARAQSTVERSDALEAIFVDMAGTVF